MQHHRVSIRSAFATLWFVVAYPVVILHNEQLIGQQKNIKRKESHGMHNNQNSYTGQQVSKSQVITCANCGWRVSSQGTADTSTLLVREWAGLGSGEGQGSGNFKRGQALCYTICSLSDMSSHCMICTASTPREDLPYLVMMIMMMLITIITIIVVITTTTTIKNQ